MVVQPGLLPQDSYLPSVEGGPVNSGGGWRSMQPRRIHSTSFECADFLSCTVRTNITT